MSKQKKLAPESVDILGKPLICLICNNNTFHQGKAQMNTALATFFKFDWANRSASYYSCAKYGHMSWFKQ